MRALKSCRLFLIGICGLGLGTAFLEAKVGEKEPATPPAVAIPETPEALWEQIDLQRKALGDAVTAKQKDEVHRTAEALGALVKALPAKYPNMNAQKSKSIRHESKSIEHLCGDLGDAINEGKADQAALILGQIDGALKFLKGSLAKKA